MQCRREFICYDEVVSTNDSLKYRIRKSHYPVVTAERQTGGKGRLGRNFFSSGGIYFSVPYTLTGKEKHIPFLTLAAGIAVHRALLSLFRLNGEIKWPNDIYVDDRKLVGILTELVSFPSLTAIVGIGINIDNQFPTDISHKATSLSMYSSYIDKYDLVAQIVQNLDDIVLRNNALNHPEYFKSELLSNSYTLGKRVTLHGEVGIAVDITEDGLLVVAFPDGRQVSVLSGEVDIKYD